MLVHKQTLRYRKQGVNNFCMHIKSRSTEAYQLSIQVGYNLRRTNNEASGSFCPTCERADSDAICGPCPNLWVWNPVVELTRAAYGNGFDHKQICQQAVEDQEPCEFVGGFDRLAVALGQTARFWQKNIR